MVIRACKPGDAVPGKDVCLYTRDGSRLLGRHSDKQSTYRQEAAIQARTNPESNFPSIYVYGLHETEELFRLGRTERIVAMISIGDVLQEEPWFLEEACDQGIEVLRLEFQDTEKPDEGGPDEEDAEALVTFLKEVLPIVQEEEGVLLLHCQVGKSRSGAAAALAWMLALPNAPPNKIASVLLHDRPQLDPNKLLLRLGTPLTGRRAKFAHRLQAALGKQR